ncbi:hypothetical protein Lal_00046487 [Lupinus albus]|nr:hypothetical protein Lal_00046487 [Lupinus albus]
MTMNAASAMPTGELSRGNPAAGRAVRIAVKNLNFYYGSFHGLKNVNLDFFDRKPLPGAAGRGGDSPRRPQHPGFEHRPERAALAHRHGVPEAHALPDVDLRQRGLGLRLYEKLPKSELDGRVEESLRKSALWDEVKDKLKQPGTGLSGGQQQRLCIARTVAQKPEVILFDEPTSALDPISTGRIEELMEQLRDEFTIVIVTHNMQQAARISQYTAFMYLGELVEFGQTEKIFMNPNERRTQDYITGRFGKRGGLAMPGHIVTSYDTDLENLRRSISEMGGVAEKMTGEATLALARQDEALAQSVILADKRLDTLQREIEEKAVLLIARRQPLAVDLRETISAIRVSGISSASATWPRTSPSASPPSPTKPRPEDRARRAPHERPRRGPAQGCARRLCQPGHQGGA